MRLSDAIEQFIKEMMQEESHEHTLELQRNELAEYFRCAPSQINYVLSTRFTPDHGYTTESRRGGGGCIRIIRLSHQKGDYLHYLLQERVGEEIDATSARTLCAQLAEREIISLKDAELMYSAISPQALSLPMPPKLKNALRARIMYQMLLSIAKRSKEEKTDAM